MHVTWRGPENKCGSGSFETIPQGIWIMRSVLVVARDLIDR